MLNPLQSCWRRSRARSGSTHSDQIDERPTSSFALLVASVVIVLLAGLLAAPAHAAITCGPGNVNKPLSAGTIAAPVNVPVGAVVGTIAPNAFQVLCRFLSTTTPNNVTSASLYSDFKTTAPLAAGFNDVYQTTVAGLGIRYTFNSAQCSASGVTLTNGAIRLACPFSGPLDGPYMNADVSVTVEFVATGPIASGASTLSTAPVVTIGFATSDQGGYWNQSPLYSGSASGVLTHATCSVNQSSVAVTMSTADTRAFSSIGAVAAPQAFSLSLSCATGAKVLITLSDSVNPANRSTALQLSPDSTAQGIGVQILNSSGSPVAFGPDSAAPGNTNQWTIGDSPNGTLQVPLTARYVRTGSVSAGSVKALATFTMSYQ
ncbi:Fimbrial protein precursor [Paraburkholderia caribensis MBA4]|uniref:Fimbrial protein n=1 Tax=Paraburkholderia caribensis MBA4 TaxID=1323664 RepID=A0A0P0RHF8_9BURK|nr:fimbrial protein [Paraburkholderia caribensis]ALL68001.1 Fimbrial protein precursor [Paraburkholderia caribensis MBA4]